MPSKNAEMTVYKNASVVMGGKLVNADITVSDGIISDISYVENEELHSSSVSSEKTFFKNQYFNRFNNIFLYKFCKFVFCTSNFFCNVICNN